MSREDVLVEILGIPNKNILCELATGYGKSKIAIEVVKSRKVKKLLIVVPRNPLKDNWREEITKWWPKCKAEITMSTYVSLPKHANEWDAVIFDECHHLSERCRESLCSFNIKNSILLSATVKDSMRDELKEIFGDLYCYKVSMKSAIDDKVLPDPKVLLLPLTLDNTLYTHSFEINPKVKGEEILIPYEKRWLAKKDIKHKYRVKCTPQQYYNELCGKIDWYKRKSYISYMKTKWLRECGVRLKWLSSEKETIVKAILSRVSNHRSLTFCSSIEQTISLGEFCINSKNKDSLKHLKMFNEGSINHITAVDMINEGMNLTDCEVGIYAALNSSETLIKQKLGRILRHKRPVIIIPFYKNTREEEIVHKMLEDYNPQLVSIINYVTEINI